MFPESQQGIRHDDIRDTSADDTFADARWQMRNSLDPAPYQRIGMCSIFRM